jgi:hypothetical protein
MHGRGGESPPAVAAPQPPSAPPSPISTPPRSPLSGAPAHGREWGGDCRASACSGYLGFAASSVRAGFRAPLRRPSAVGRVRTVRTFGSRFRLGGRGRRCMQNGPAPQSVIHSCRAGVPAERTCVRARMDGDPLLFLHACPLNPMMQLLCKKEPHVTVQTAAAEPVWSPVSCVASMSCQLSSAASAFSGPASVVQSVKPLGIFRKHGGQGIDAYKHTGQSGRSGQENLRLTTAAHLRFCHHAKQLQSYCGNN